MREGLDGLLVPELRFVALVCNFFSRPSTRCSKELILAFSCAIESSLQLLRSVAPVTRNVMIKRTTTAAIDFDVCIFNPFAYI